MEIGLRIFGRDEIFCPENVAEEQTDIGTLAGWFRFSGGLLMRVNWEEFKQIYDDENSEYFEEVDDDDDWPVVL